jgi:hypothetical protein
MPNTKFSQLPVTGNVTAATIVPVVESGVNYQVSGANLQAFVNNSTGNITGGNIVSLGAVTATGNVSGSYILGNGSLLTGIPASYGNANVAAYLPTFTGNLAGGNAIITSGVSAATFTGSAAGLTNIPGANVTGVVANASYATAAGSATTATSATTAGTVTTGAQPNITSVGTLSVVNTSGNITALGNIAGSYFVGNGSALTGIVANTTYNDSNVAAFLPTYTGAMTAMTGALTTTGNVTGAYVKGNGSQLTGTVTSIVAGSGISISGPTGAVTVTATGAGSSTTISSGNNYANTAYGSGKLVINGGNSSANAASINGLGANTLALFNAVGNCYIELTESGNIWLKPGAPSGLQNRFTYLQDLTLIEGIGFPSSRGVAPGTNTSISAQGIDFQNTIFRNTMQVPTYTVASKPFAPTALLGQVIAITDSPTNNGRLAYYCSNNARWQYVDTNGAV